MGNSLYQISGVFGLFFTQLTGQQWAEVRYYLLPISCQLDKYERIMVKSRIKECDSALDALRRRQEGKTFDRDRPELYTLLDLNDLAGVRILAFPMRRLSEINQILLHQFSSWQDDPVKENGTDETLAWKYFGLCPASDKVKGELQIVPMLTGLFWEIEHAAMYKPTPELKGIVREEEMKNRRGEVYKAIKAFEEEFEKCVQQTQNMIIL